MFSHVQYTENAKVVEDENTNSAKKFTEEIQSLESRLALKSSKAENLADQLKQTQTKNDNQVASLKAELEQTRLDLEKRLTYERRLSSPTCHHLFFFLATNQSSNSRPLSPSSAQKIKYVISFPTAIGEILTNI